MNMRDRLDPELVSTLEMIEKFTGGGLDLQDIPAARTLTKQLSDIKKSQAMSIEGVTVEKREVLSGEGEPDVPVMIFRPEDSLGKLPALVWMHGGGYVIGTAEQDDLFTMSLAKSVGCVVVSVDYRLAPECPFPKPLEDCYTALKWLSTHCDELNVEKSSIAIGGASAGAGLTAGLALLVRDRAEIELVFQLLIYPMIDDCNVAPADENLPDTFIWNRACNLIGWGSYLGHEPGGKSVSPYAAAYRGEDLSGLPPAYIAVGELDLFLTENIEYAQRLLQNGVPTELHVYPGAFHGFNGYVPEADVSKRFNLDFTNALKKALFT